MMGRRFYQACSFLPDPFTVCYSYKYYDHEAGLQILREADFVIAHPALGFVVSRSSRSGQVPERCLARI